MKHYSIAVDEGQKEVWVVEVEGMHGGRLLSDWKGPVSREKAVELIGGTSVEESLKAMEEKAEKLKNALMGLIGASDRQELQAMKDFMDLITPIEDRRVTKAAIDALLETMAK